MLFVLQRDIDNLIDWILHSVSIIIIINDTK